MNYVLIAQIDVIGWVRVSPYQKVFLIGFVQFSYDSFGKFFEVFFDE
jgi:hypothetical protein